MASKQKKIGKNFLWFTWIYYYHRLTMAPEGLLKSL